MVGGVGGGVSGLPAISAIARTVSRSAFMSLWLGDPRTFILQLKEGTKECGGRVLGAQMKGHE